MEIRRLQPEEHIIFDGMCRTVFCDMPRVDVREKMQDPLAHAKNDDSLRLGLFDNHGKLQSAMKIIPFTMRLNGQNVPMGGVGAVVTRPETRRRRQIYALFNAAFQEMHHSGQILSFLYPFSFAYYRKFGYEMCYAYDELKIPVPQLGGFKGEVYAEPFEPGDSIIQYATIYRQFSHERNFAVVREARDWERILDRDTYKNLRFSYLLYDSIGRAAAYILYDAEAEKNRVIIRECCWLNPDALGLVFSFLSKLTEFGYIQWNAPCDVDPFALLPEGFEIKHRRKPAAMARLVNIYAALGTLRAPRRSGRVSIGVTDNSLPHNTGVYAVEWEGGAVSVEKLGDAAPLPDLETTAETLAQLVTGYLTPEAAMYKPCTRVTGTLTGLNALFPKKRLFIAERF